LNFGELFEVERERERNGIERAVRLATTREIYMRDTIGKCQFAVTGETIEYEGESLVALNIAWTFEIFIERGADQILGGWDKARRGDFIRKLPGN
jgi:hypothetical protein